jgi:hypothetical protein
VLSEVIRRAAEHYVADSLFSCAADVTFIAVADSATEPGMLPELEASNLLKWRATSRYITSHGDWHAENITFAVTRVTQSSNVFRGAQLNPREDTAHLQERYLQPIAAYPRPRIVRVPN